MTSRYYVRCEDLCVAMVGPFATIDEAEQHVEFLVQRDDADPGAILTNQELIDTCLSDPYTLILTPEQDRDFRG